MNPHGRRFRALGLLAAGSLVFIAGGCVQESNVNGEHIFQHEWWVWFLSFVGGAGAMVGGWFLRKTSERYGWVLLMLGAIGAIFLAPMYFFDRIVITADRFDFRSGWWRMTTNSLELKDISQIRLTAKTKSTRRGGKQTDYYLTFDKKSGGSVDIPSNALLEAAADSIIAQATLRGIPIRDDTGGL